ncbi:uncharacterized protein CLUP02_18394 [Colletotrichum lupini]|uniref:Uncharacterized protein n=1 Tax=Colletotrichum lupini TaxID=145971 RepID=A0A9Q8SGC9_9PEZI|nr:uncharacterized protein CLUP02_18394 [Colletotrichum lupini]UQC76879.1 hypothetical protein CLUP02_18394 [Colletotrichum lupini]
MILLIINGRPRPAKSFSLGFMIVCSIITPLFGGAAVAESLLTKFTEDIVKLGTTRHNIVSAVEAFSVAGVPDGTLRSDVRADNVVASLVVAGSAVGVAAANDEPGDVAGLEADLERRDANEN